MKQTVLIIEDESGIADTLTYALGTEGFIALWAATGEQGRQLLKDKPVDLVIIDVGLPDISGFELLKSLRRDSDVPAIFLTARSGEIDRILGLELGADDYVVKPFSPREVVSRVKAVLRRSADKPQRESSTAPFEIDTNRRQILYYGERLVLSRYEYEILCLLINRPGWVYTREKIMDLVWEEPEESFERTVDAHIKSIRGKLRTVRPGLDPIVTHRGYGYALKDDL